MAIAPDTNDLKIFRRHLKNCTRFPHGAKQPFTTRPANPKEKKADSCNCPIWCLGYLAKEKRLIDGRLKPKRVFVSLGTDSWTAAESEIARLYARGALPTVAPAASVADIGAITVKYAAERYLQSRKHGDGSLDSIEQDTYVHYASLLDQRLIPYCAEKGIQYIRAFENKDVCRQFAESWRQLRRNVGKVLADTTRDSEFGRFKAFLNECVENDWMAKSGAEKIKLKKQKKAEGRKGEWVERKRYGLELSEYERMMAAPDSTDLTPQENRETRVAAELMRWSGLRISDCHKFNATEIVANETGNGFNADFIQKKTKKQCVVPLADHVVEMLNSLPGHIQQGKKYFFTCSYTALRGRLDVMATRAQKDRRFTHDFSPHCLRHTFAIQHINEGTDIKLVSKWLGHESVAVTQAHYGNWIKATQIMAEDVNRGANARMMEKAAAFRHTNMDRISSSDTPLGT
jgi:integrase